MTLAENATWWENAINAQDTEIQTLRDRVAELERQLAMERALLQVFSEACKRYQAMMTEPRRHDESEGE